MGTLKPAAWGRASSLQQFTGFGHAGRGAAILAGGYSGEGGELTPAVRSARGFEFLGDGPIILFGLERAILTNGVAEQEIENGTRVVAQFAVTMHDGGSVSLEILADGVVGFAEQRRGLGGFNLSDVRGQRKRLPMQEVATTVGAIERDLVCP